MTNTNNREKAQTGTVRVSFIWYPAARNTTERCSVGVHNFPQGINSEFGA